jgi:hypothetical protein
MTGRQPVWRLGAWGLEVELLGCELDGIADSFFNKARNSGWPPNCVPPWISRLCVFAEITGTNSAQP